MSDIHIIKLAVGVEDIAHLHEIQQRHVIEYQGVDAVPCWTRYKPKRGDELLEKGASIYRVVKNRIVCRHKILGFEMVETQEKGTMCAIMQEAQMMETVHMPRRAFQGWRYLKAADAPADKGIYNGAGVIEEIPADLEDELREAGLL